MGNISGIKAENDAKGNPKKVTIDLKKHPELAEIIEDYIDALDAKKELEKGDFTPVEKVKEELGRYQHRLKVSHK